MRGDFDTALFYWINRGWEPLDGFFIFLSTGIRDWPLRVLLGVVFFAMLIIGSRSRAAAIQSAIAFPIANELSDIVKNFLNSPRPCTELLDCRLLVDYLSSPGAMSAHAAAMAAVATVMCYRLGRWGWIWIVIAFLVGVSRVYVGAHYPSQVLVGWMGGFLSGWVVIKVWDGVVYFIARKNSR
ncbi:MAG TPA: phosphatase PAP2 family protein [Fimbriimonadales bacterium]|nr:phosphatase PAP2 family protein [Fimbriimonadales bacterium]